MFFLARSAICIALVVAALPDHPASLDGTTLSQVASRTGEAVIDRFCRESPTRCHDALDRMTSVASRDTLSAADRLPRWAGPALVGFN